MNLQLEMKKKKVKLKVHQCEWRCILLLVFFFSFQKMAMWEELHFQNYHWKNTSQKKVHTRCLGTIAMWMFRTYKNCMTVMCQGSAVILQCELNTVWTRNEAFHFTTLHQVANQFLLANNEALPLILRICIGFGHFEQI